MLPSHESLGSALIKMSTAMALANSQLNLTSLPLILNKIGSARDGRTVDVQPAAVQASQMVHGRDLPGKAHLEASG